MTEKQTNETKVYEKSPSYLQSREFIVREFTTEQRSVRFSTASGNGPVTESGPKPKPEPEPGNEPVTESGPKVIPTRQLQRALDKKKHRTTQLIHN